jgi:hypothetical protein
MEIASAVIAVSFTQLWCAGSDTTRAAIAGHHSEISTPRKAAGLMKSCGFFIADLPGVRSIDDDVVNDP